MSEIKAAGGTAIANGASVTDDAGVAHLVKQTMSTFGRVDVLIANAGILRDKSFVKMEIKDFEVVMAVHVMGTVKPAKALWQIMRDQKYGRIVVTTSSTGLYGNFGQTNYGAAEARPRRLHEHAEARRREGQHQGQRDLPGRRHAHDGEPHAAASAGHAEARICDAGRRVSGERRCADRRDPGRRRRHLLRGADRRSRTASISATARTPIRSRNIGRRSATSPAPSTSRWAASRRRS